MMIDTNLNLLKTYDGNYRLELNASLTENEIYRLGIHLQYGNPPEYPSDKVSLTIPQPRDDASDYVEIIYQMSVLQIHSQFYIAPIKNIF